MTKAELRKTMREAKACQTADGLRGMSREICGQIAASPLWQTARTVLLYHPLPDEVDLTPLMRQAVAEGKTVLLPVVAGDDLTMCEYEGEDSLLTGAYGIKEPAGRECADPAAVDLAIVPGMAFDRAGRRLGRGKGYYDRLLPHLTNAHRMGVCFPFQMVECVPTNMCDESVDAVIPAGICVPAPSR